MATQLSLMKGPFLSEAVLVDALGDEFFARAGLPRDEDRGVRRGYLEDLAEDPPHDLALADDLGKELPGLHLGEHARDLLEDEVELADVVGLMIHGALELGFRKGGQVFRVPDELLDGPQDQPGHEQRAQEGEQRDADPQDFRSHGVSTLYFA